MASSLRNLARRTVPKAPTSEPEAPSVTEEAPPVIKEPEVVVAPPEIESASEGHVTHLEPVTEETPSGEAAEDVVETEPEPTVEEAPVVVSAPVKEVKVTTPSRSKKKKAQKVVTTGEAPIDEKKEAETK